MGVITAVAIITALVFAGDTNKLFMPYVAVPGTPMLSSPTSTYTTTPSLTPTATPSPTTTPIHTATFVPTATHTSSPIPPTATHTPMATLIAITPPSPCGTQFEAPPIVGNTFVHVTGEVGTIVQITDLSTGVVLGADIFIAEPGHACPGFADFAPPKQLDPPLLLAHVILAQNLDNNTIDTAVVVLSIPTPGPGTPSATPTNTSTPIVTATPSITPTPTETPGPGTPSVTPTPTNDPSVTDTPTPIITPTPTTPSPNILFVVGDLVLSPADASVRVQLAALNPIFPGDLSKILVMEDTVVITSDASGKDLIVISDSVNANDVNTKFRNVPVPVLLWEDNLYDDMGMTANSGQSGFDPNQTQIVIINDTHPLAGSLSTGTYTVYSAAADLTWGSPGTYGTKIATLTTDNTKFVVFGYEVGAAMPNLPNTAPARRVGFMMRDIDLYNDLTGTGLLLFNTAVLWTADW